MADRIEAVRADRDALVEIAASLHPEQWQEASGCQGWSVQDLVAHMSLTFWSLVDPGRLPNIAGMPFERAQDVLVASRRELDPAHVMADYAEVSERALQMLPGLAGLEMDMPLGDAGSYPISLLPCAYGFDHYIHIRADLFSPRGPLRGTPPPSDEPHVTTALDWIEAALPQQNQAAAALGTFEFQVAGTGARLIKFGSGSAKATVSCDAPAFIRWVTQRGSWADLGVQAGGDESALAAAQHIRVF